MPFIADVIFISVTSLSLSPIVNVICPSSILFLFLFFFKKKIQFVGAYVVVETIWVQVGVFVDTSSNHRSSMRSNEVPLVPLTSMPP